MATAELASIALEIAPLAIEVVLPVEVTTPVRFAFVVTVAALPVMLPAIGLVTVKSVSVPTEVNEEFTTVDFKVVPINWFAYAAAVMSILAVPSKATPLIVRAVSSLVAVAALPVTLPAIGAVTVNPVKVPTEVIAGWAAAVTVAADPVTLPVIGAVTVKPVNVPTEVIAGWAAVVTVPAVVALVAVVAVAAFPVILPAIGLVTVRSVKVPTEVRDEFNIVDFKVLPINELASAAGVMVISEVPSKGTPLIFLGVDSLVAVPAFPVTEPLIGLVTVRFDKVPTEVSDELTIEEFNVVPVSLLASAAAVMVISAVPSNGTPLIFLGVPSLVAVAAFPVTLPAIGLVTERPVNVPTEVIAGCAASVTVRAVAAVAFEGTQAVPFQLKT